MHFKRSMESFFQLVLTIPVLKVKKMSLSVLSLSGTEGRSFIVTCQTRVKSVKGKLIRELNVLTLLSSHSRSVISNQ